MMTLLLDSSSKVMALALARNGIIIASIEEAAFQRQSELLTLRIKEMLADNNINPQAISEVVVTKGPGSFTGVRIAVTIAKVMAYSLNIPLYAVSSLSVYKVSDKKTLAVLDARNGRSYVGTYEKDDHFAVDLIMNNEEVLALASQKDYVIAGECAHLNVESAHFNRFSNMLAQIGSETLVTDIASFKPVYLKG